MHHVNDTIGLTCVLFCGYTGAQGGNEVKTNGLGHVNVLRRTISSGYIYVLYVQYEIFNKQANCKHVNDEGCGVDSREVPSKGDRLRVMLWTKSSS